jgi:LPS-assembly protein
MLRVMSWVAPCTTAWAACATFSLSASFSASVNAQPVVNAQPLPACYPAATSVRNSRALPFTRTKRDPRAPILVEANRMQGRAAQSMLAEGDVRLQQGPVLLRTDRLSFDNEREEVKAFGNVSVERDGDIFRGQELQIHLPTFEGFVLDPKYHFARTNAGGRAQRIDFMGNDRATITKGDYTSCPRDDATPEQPNPRKPAWLLRSDRVRLDFDANEGVADGAVLEFLGVPILAAPVLRFPITDERKSGWLPPSLNLDNKKGLEVSVPYYWNIAPHHDATVSPILYSRRGAALAAEYRYLGATHGGVTEGHWLPNDRITGKARYAFTWKHRDLGWSGFRLDANVERASDDSYWKDFPRHIETLTPRLLAQDLRAERAVTLGPFDGMGYARLQHWQVLQDADPLARIVSPYQRSPQLGWRATRPWRSVGANVALEAEINHFTLPTKSALNGTTAFPEGWRAHILGSASRRWSAPGWWLEPGLKLNAAAYRTEQPMVDGARNASRVIPTASFDTGLIFERDSTWFGRPYLQTLEPRLRYVNTPPRNQAALPNFDAAGTDFNVVSIFGDNAFSGVDRVSDAHQVTAGATSRWLAPDTGVERLRLGAVQRYLLRDQQITPDGVPTTQRLSDVLLFGQSTLSERWTLGGALQYSPDNSRVTRSVLSARYNAGPFRTVGVGYRFVRGASEQVDVGWQWPIYGDAMRGTTSLSTLASSSRECRGTLYSVGRVNYSRRDSRITDSLVGFEYDAGCWIGRTLVERLSTGRSEATTRYHFQIELVGLSRLGTNPLRVLKDNIPGYRLLRDDAAPIAPPPVYD